MYLKCIEVQGFKSFANRIKFEFHNGIRESWAQTEVERAMWQMQSAGCWESREQSSFEAVPCRMSFFRNGKQKAVELCFGSHHTGQLGSSAPVDYSEVTVTRRLIPLR